MRIKDGFELRRSGDIYLAAAVGDMAEKFPQAIQMNETGARIWRMLSAGSYTREDVLEELFAFYEEAWDLLEQDVDGFVAFLKQYDLLEE